MLDFDDVDDLTDRRRTGLLVRDGKRPDHANRSIIETWTDGSRWSGSERRPFDILNPWRMARRRWSGWSRILHGVPGIDRG